MTQTSSLSEIAQKARQLTRADSVEFPVMLANHAPMVLVAMQQMGASDEQRLQWHQAYKTSHNVPSPEAARAPLTVETWPAALGDRSREMDARVFFEAEVTRLGMDGAIRHYLPKLALGMAGSALHPLMRLAYAILADDAQEVGTALGYWACTYLPISLTDGMPKTQNPIEIISGIPDLPGVREYTVEIDLLWKNIAAVSKLPGFSNLVGRLEMGPDVPRDMAAAALALYAQTMDFSALHAVTGLHWLRLTRPHLDDPDALYPIFWAIIASLVPKIGFPDLPTAEALEAMRNQPAPEWPEIFATACASDDEHDISLVYSASQEEQVWGDPLYRVVAARRVGLIGDPV